MGCKSCVRNQSPTNTSQFNQRANPQISPQVAQQSMTNQIVPNQQPAPNQPPQDPGSWTDYLKYLFTPYVAAQNKEALVGSPSKTEQIPRFTPEQMAQQNELGQMAMQGLKGAQFNMNPVEQRLRRLYSEQEVPTIANRFLAGKAGNSSDYQNALRGGGLDLEERIGMAQNAFNQQQFQNALQLLPYTQQQQFESLYHPESWGLAGKAGNAGLALLATYLMGPQAGAALAAQGLAGGGGAQQRVQGAPQEGFLPSSQGQSTSNLLNNIPLLNLIDSMQKGTGSSTQQPQPAASPSDITGLQALVSNLGTVDVNRLRQQQLLKQLQPLLNLYGLGR